MEFSSKPESPLEPRIPTARFCGVIVPPFDGSGAPTNEQGQHYVCKWAASLPLIPRGLLAIPSLPERTLESPSCSAAGGGCTTASDGVTSPAVVIPKLWQPGNTPRPSEDPPSAATA